MRWPRPLLPLGFSHSVSTSTSTSTSRSCTDDLVSSLPYISSLRLLSPFLDSKLITKALLSLSSPLPAFRLYLLASSHPRLHSIKSVNRIVSLFLKYPDSLPHALDLIYQFKSHGRNYIKATAFEPLITAYAKSGQPEKAVEVFERMLPDFGCQPNSWVYGILLKMFVEKGVVLLALAVYKQMLKSNCRPYMYNYVVVMDGLCKAEMIKDATQLFEEMTQRGVYPNACVYNIFITASCRAGKFDDAIQLLHLMKEKGCEPRKADYDSIISGLCKLGRVDDAFAQLAVFQDAGFVLGLEGYSSLIDGLFKVRRFNEACWYFHKMLNENVKPDTIIYTIMINGLFKVRRFNEACWYFHKMLNENVKPDTIIYTIMIKIYAEEGCIEDCFSLLKQMTDGGLVPDAVCYNTLIKALCDAGQLDRARSLQLEITKFNIVPDSATYSIMLGGLCNAGMVDEAQKIFDEMSSLGIQPTIYSYNSLVNGLCKAGRMDQAQLLIYKMEMGQNPFLFLRLLQGTDRVRDSAGLRKRIDELCQSGQVLEGYKLLHGILNSGVMPDIIIYNTLIDGFCKIGDIDGALKLLKELQIKGYSPDEFTYCTLLNGLLEARRDQDFDKLFKHLVRTGFQPIASVYYQFMKSLGRKKMVEQAVRLWLDYLAQECVEVEAAKTISDIREHYENGSLEDAVRGLLELDRVHGSVGPDPYTIWLTGFCLAGRVNDAFTIYILLREYGLDLTPASCSVLIDHLCLTNNLGWSVHLVFYSVKKRFVLLNKDGINSLIETLCLQNNRSLAQVVVSRLCIVGYNLKKYITENTKQLLLQKSWSN